MKYLLFEGASNVGKTTSIVRFVNNLVSSYGYVCKAGKIPSLNSTKDFNLILEKANDKTGKKRIAVFSASDTKKIINDNFLFCKLNKPYDLLIASCREEKVLNNHFYKVFAITSKDKVFEIPMAKITHRVTSLKVNGMKWYKTKIDMLADFLFQQL